MSIILEDITEVKHDKISHLLDKETNEPLFVIKPTPRFKSREVHLSWHPHMLKIHPDLKDSIEHNQSGYFDNKTEAISHANNLYENAARMGFADKIKVKKQEMTHDEISDIAKQYQEHHNTDLFNDGYENSVKTKTSFYDPDTNELIGVSKFNPQFKSQKFHYIKEYTDKNNINENTLKTLLNKASTQIGPTLLNHYNKAVEIYNNKGKQPRLSGFKQKGGYSSFKINTTPEAASQAHEDYIKKSFPTSTITRHSPTSFTSHTTPEGQYSNGKIIHSFIDGNILHSSQSTYDHPDYSGSDSNTLIIESEVS